MQYEVISPFVDKETGKEFTKDDKYISKNAKRIKELSSCNNAAGTPLIRNIPKKEKNGESKNG